MNLIRRLWIVLTRWRHIQDLDEEMRLHVELRAAANRRKGLAADEAERQARRRFGNRLKLREESRDAWGFVFAERLLRDVRHASRQVIRSPLSTVVVVATLALGIGANTAMFTLVDLLLFRPAPWSTTDRVVWISSSIGPSGGGSLSYPDYRFYRDWSRTLSAIAAFGGNGVSVGGPHPARVLGGLVSGNFFDVVGIRPALGRTFTPDDDAAPGAHPLVVLSDAFWRERFGGDPAAINRLITINGVAFTIIGVAPAGFTGFAYADNAEQLWMPLAMQPVVMAKAPQLLTAPDEAWVHVVGRLATGASLAEADAEMRVLAGRLNPPGTPPARTRHARATPARGGMTPWEQRDLAPVFGLVAIVPGLVLLVACANVGNVLLARHVARRREFALRRAIGASRGTLVRQLLTEALLVALLSSAAGFAASFVLIAVIAHYGNIPSDFATLLTPDRRALYATTVLAIGTIVFFALAPALTATRFDVLPALKEEGTTATGARGRRRLQRAFVVAQIALSLGLIIVAGLFLQSLSRAARVDPGFDPRGLVTVSFNPEDEGYPTVRRDAFVGEFLARARRLPDVMSAATASTLPVAGEMYGAPVVGERTTAAVPTSSATVSPGYFDTLGIPLVRGRGFADRDGSGAPRVALVNETLARRLWPGVDPIGQRFRVENRPLWREVIGVVRDAKYVELTESPRAAWYAPAGQQPGSQVSLIVRSAGDTRAALTALAGIARELDPDLPLFKTQTIDEIIRHTLSLQRAVASLVGVFGTLTLLLTAIGIYGVAAHAASARTREVGIRISLGARRADVARMFVRESLAVSIAGIGIGAAMSAAASKLLTAYLYGLTATDGVTFVAGAAIMCLVTVAASYVPARRAARIEPLVALRHE